MFFFVQIDPIDQPYPICLFTAVRPDLIAPALACNYGGLARFSLMPVIIVWPAPFYKTIGIT